MQEDYSVMIKKVKNINDQKCRTTTGFYLTLTIVFIF